MVKVYNTYKMEQPMLMFSNRPFLLVHNGMLITAANQYIFLSAPRSTHPHTILKRATSSPVTALRLSPDGFLLAGYGSGEMVAWNLTDSFEERVLVGHQSAITWIGQDRSGGRLVTAGLDCLLMLWDFYGEEVVQKVEGHKGAVVRAEFVEAADKSFIVSCGKDGFLKLWSEKLQALDIFNTNSPESCIFHLHEPTNTIILSNARQQLFQLSIKQSKIHQECVLERPSCSPVTFIGANGDTVMLLTKEKSIEKYLILGEEEVKRRLKRREKREREKGRGKQIEGKDQEKEVVVCPIAYVQSQHFSERPRAIAYLKGQPLILLKNGLKGQQQRPPLNPLTSLSLSQPYLCCLQHSNFNAYTLTEHPTLQYKHANVESFAMLPNTSLCVMVTNDHDGKHLRLLSIRTREELHVTGYGLGKGGVGVGEDSAGVKVIGWGGKEVTGFAVVRGDGVSLIRERAVTLPENIVKAMFTPNGAYLAVALADNSIRLLFTDSYKLFLSLHGNKLPITDMDIATDSTILATTSVDKDIKVWALDYGNFFVKPIFAHSEAGTVLRFVNDTHYLLSGGRDGKVKFWDVDLRELIFEFEEFQKATITGLTVSPCGGYFFVSAADLGIRLYRQTKDQTVFKEQEQKRLQKQAGEEFALKEGSTLINLKHGEQIIQFLESTSSPQEPDLPGLLQLFSKISISNIHSYLSFLHRKHKDELLKYVKIMVEHGIQLELAWRIIKAIKSRKAISIRDEWVRMKRVAACNLEAIKIVQSRLKERTNFL